MSPISSTTQASRDTTASSAHVPRWPIVWYEQLANDESVATRFYTTVLGWTTEPFKCLRLALLRCGASGEEFRWSDGAPPGRRMPPVPLPTGLGYVTVPDVDASFAQAKRLGAQGHMGPMESRMRDRMA